LACDGLAVVRYPSGEPDAAIAAAFYPDGEEGDPRVRVWETGPDPRVTVVTHGRIAGQALQAAEALLAQDIPIRVLLCEYLAPYRDLANEVAPLIRGAVLLLEEEIRTGGFGLSLADALGVRLSGVPHTVMALNDPFLTPAAGQTIWEAAGLSAQDVQNAVRELLRAKGV
jgi:deoxyxylulose-5-phosphate synthase